MRYLLEHQVGFDKHLLGFPSVKGCAAIVFVDPTGLFGYHMPQVSHSIDARFNEFGNFISRRNPNFDSECRMYVVTFSDQRYISSKGETLGKEIKQIASHFKFKGKKRGIDLHAAPFQPKHGSAYIEFARSDKKCNVYVKGWEDKLNMTGGNNKQMVPDNDLAMIKSKSGGITMTDAVNDGIVRLINRDSITKVASTRF